MSIPEAAYAIGQAVYVRTDNPDFSEETIPFKTLEEMVLVCSVARQDLTLEKVIIYATAGAEACSLTLGFVSASKGRRPGTLESVLNDRH